VLLFHRAGLEGLLAKWFPNGEEDKCAKAMCPKDMCPDGKGRREIDGECCKCPKDTGTPGTGGPLICDKKSVKQGCRLNSQCIETCPGLKLKQRHGSIEFGEADISLVRESKGQMKIKANAIKVDGKLYLNAMENSLDDIVMDLRKKVADLETIIGKLTQQLKKT